MPTGHVSTVNQDRLFLIAAILDGSPINVGQIIEAQIRHCAARTAGEMFFPSLISFMCQRIGLTPPSHVPSSYLSGTITMNDLRRILPVLEPVPPPAPVVPTSSADLSVQASSMSSTASSSATPTAAHGVASDSDSDRAAPPDSPIDVSNTAMPDLPPTQFAAPTRRSNRVKARIITSSSPPQSSSWRSKVSRHRPKSSLPTTVPPMTPPASLLNAPLASLVVPPLVLPTVPMVPVSSAPPVSSVLPPPLPSVFIPPPVPMVPPSSTSPAPGPSPPVFPPSASLSSLPVPPVSSFLSSPPAPHSLRNRLVDILRTLADNQALYHDYVLARDHHLQVLLEQLFQRLFGIEPTPWPPAPAFHVPAPPDEPSSNN